MKKLKCTFKTVIFILIFVLLFSGLSELVARKTLNGAWNHTMKISGFYNEGENEFDVLYFGSSNTYCSFNPLIIYEGTGIKSYVLATQNQPVWTNYRYMIEALKTQKPELLVLDVHMFSKHQEYFDEGVNYSFMDDIPMSMNKIRLAFESAPTYDEAIRLLVNFIKYHSRWSELKKEDYEFDRDKTNDYLKGYVLLEDIYKDGQKPSLTEEKSSLIDKELKAFDNIIKLVKDKNIRLLLVKTPSNQTEEEAKYFNEVERLAKESNVDYINYNRMYEEIGLDLEQDFYDKSHLNYKGAEKFSRYFKENLKEYIEIDKMSDEEWDKDLKSYYEYIYNIK